MPAYFDKGFCVRTPSWHGQETLLQDYPGREEAMKLAGHDFKVCQAPVLVQGKRENRPASFSVEGLAINPGEPIAKGFKALLNGTTGDVLNIVRASYEVVQNEVLWDVVDALVGQPNVKYDTAGVLEGGAKLWVAAYLDEPFRIPGDDSLTLPYISAATTHDGSGSLRARSHVTRVVCANTDAMAESEARKHGTLFTFRHTKQVKTRIDEAIAVVRGTRTHANAYQELALSLASLPITPAQHRQFIEQFIPMPPVAAGVGISDRVVSNIEAARLKVELLFDGPTIPEAHRATGYGLLLAGVEYLDHLRGYRDPGSYIGRTLLRSEPAKEGLSNLIRLIAAN